MIGVAKYRNREIGKRKKTLNGLFKIKDIG